MALCTNNISDFTVKEVVMGSDDYANLVGAFVCQSTIIPSESKGFRAALSSQSIILADTFLGKFPSASTSMHIIIYGNNSFSSYWCLPHKIKACRPKLSSCKMVKRNPMRVRSVGQSQSTRRFCISLWSALCYVL